MKLYDIIVESAEKALETIEQGHMPPGHDGPHFDMETPVRNSSHWLITFLKVYEITGNNQFRNAAADLAEFLIGEEARPMGATFWHRKNPKKDFCNNLIGQAWTIEALGTAAKKLGNPEYERVAKEVFLLHPFDYEMGLWERCNVDGSYSTVDQTFNHQLWFAATGSMLDIDKTNIHRFIDMVPDEMVIKPSGLIYIQIRGASKRIEKKLYWFLVYLWNSMEKEVSRYKAIGYHAFHLYGFALLYENIPDHPFWQSRMFKKALLYILRESYERELDHTFNADPGGRMPPEDKSLIHNRYGYAYNPPGFEIAFALLTFKHLLPSRIDVSKLASYWISKQIKRCYNFDTKMMKKNTEDPLTLAARLYEATRLPNLELDLDNVTSSPSGGKILNRGG